MVSFAEGISVKPSSSHTYQAHFHDNWCIGSGKMPRSFVWPPTELSTVPHGGYITSCFMQVAATHFATTLAKQNQPHTITLHLEFVRRTEVGPAEFRVRDVKLGRLTSTIHISLFQNGREEVIGYFTNSNIPRENGPTFDTHWKLDPPTTPAKVSAMMTGKDTEWAERQWMPFAEFRKASANMRFFFPKNGQIEKGLADQWMAFKNGERFTNTSLGMVADMFPQLPETFRSETDPYSVEAEVKGIDTEAEARKKGSAKFWYPTLLLNLDVKKALPEEGVDVLFVRTRAKRIQNGRYDLEIVIMDDSGDIVALSHHVCMILPAERNLAKRSTSENSSKL